MIIKVRVKTNSKEESVRLISPREYYVCLKEEAEDGKANKRLVKLLSSEFNVDWKAIRLKTQKAEIISMI